MSGSFPFLMIGFPQMKKNAFENLGTGFGGEKKNGSGEGCVMKDTNDVSTQT